MKKLILYLFILLIPVLSIAQNAVEVGEVDSVDWYQHKYDKALMTKKVGMGLTFAGLGLSIIGIVVVAGNIYPHSGSLEAASAGAILTLIGGITMVLGIPVAIVGAHNAKKFGSILHGHENGKHFTLGITQHGVGLTLKL